MLVDRSLNVMRIVIIINNNNIAAETMGAISKDGVDFLCEHGRRITQCTDDHRKSAFLFQRLSVLIQRYNAVAVFGYLHPHNRSSICSNNNNDDDDERFV